jgi:energy-coupling factor transporter transmembrane protein EcfT
LYTNNADNTDREASVKRRKKTPSSLSIRLAFAIFLALRFLPIVQQEVDAIESRGFGAYPDRTYVKSFCWTRTGIFLILSFLAFAACLIDWDRVIP